MWRMAERLLTEGAVHGMDAGGGGGTGEGDEASDGGMVRIWLAG